MNELTDKMLNYINAAETLIYSQLPDFIQQYLMWGMAKAIFYIAIAAIILLFLVITTLILWKTLPKEEEDFGGYNGNPRTTRGLLFIFSSIFTTSAFVIFILIASFNSYDIIQIKVAPKVYLVEQLTNHLKK